MVMDSTFFAEFNFAPSHQAVNSAPSVINGHDSTSNAFDDDDWGDFVVNSSPELAHTVSLPRLSKPLDPPTLAKEDSLDLYIQPGSAPGRVNSGSIRWQKPNGALPLSLFGLEEEEEEKEEEKSVTNTTSVRDLHKSSNHKTNDLIANLNINNNNNYNEASPRIEVTNVKLNLDWDPLNVNSTAAKKEGNSIVNGNERFEGVDDEDDDGWEFKDAQEISKTEVVEAQNGMLASGVSNGFNVNWNMTDLDFNGWSYHANAGVPSSNSLTKNPVENVKEPHNADGDVDDDDDGWEFMGADLEPQTGGDKGAQIKTEITTVKNPSSSLSSWDALFSASNVLNSNEKLTNGKSMEDFGGADGWAFKGTEPGLQVRDENSEIKPEKSGTQNPNWISSCWNTSSLNGSLTVNSNGSNVDTKRGDSDLFAENQMQGDLDLFSRNEKQQDMNLFDEVEDLYDDDGWEFKNAEAASTSEDRNTKDDKIMPENMEGITYTTDFGNVIPLSGDLLVASQETSQKLSESNFEYAFNSTNKSGQNGFHFSTIDVKVDSDENLWALKDAVSEIVSKDEEVPGVLEASPPAETLVFDDKIQKNMERPDNQKGALPLSFFGDEELETDDSGIYQDIATQRPTSVLKDGVKSPHLNLSANDLISSLYGQAEQTDSANHAQNLNENGSTASDLAVSNLDLDDDSWEFQDAVARAEARHQTSVLSLEDSLQKDSSREELYDYVLFFSKLKEELQRVACSHLENLKRARNAASLTGDDAEVQALDKKIQDIRNELFEDSIFPSEVSSENHLAGDACLSVYIEVLQEPKFEAFESEYQLMKKLLLAESSLQSAIELLKHVDLTFQILASVSKEEQLNYISAWLKMLSVCAQELRHGTFILRQSLQENVHGKMLSKPQGKNYVLALGEIYRVVEVLGSSAKLYKPWILANSPDSTNVFSLLSECFSLWSSSGLEESLKSILDSDHLEDDGNCRKLLDSIKYIHNQDALSLYHHVFSGEGRTCKLSALSADTVPGMKTVVWNGEHCFLPLANLWGNLVSSDPPNLPCLHFG